MLLALPRRAKSHSRSWSRSLTYHNSLVCPGSSYRSRQRRRSWQLHALVPATKRVNWVQPTWSYTRLPLLIREEIEVYQNWSPAFPTKRKLWNIIDHWDEDSKLQSEYNSAPIDARPMVDGIDESEAYLTARERDLLVSQLNEQHQQNVISIQEKIDSFFLSVTKDVETTPGTALRLGSPPEVNAQLTADEIFDQFRSMPADRLAYFDDSTRDGLLEYLLTASQRDHRMTPLLLTIMDEVRESQLVVPHKFHDQAIRLIGRESGRITPQSATDALSRWEKMEKMDGVQSNEFTFNVLLNIAVKAGYYTLFDSLMDLIKERRVPINDYILTMIIYYHGIRGDGDGIRRTFREFISSGFPVSTAVLNCVIASLLRADEAGAAHAVYCRMKEWAVTAEQEDTGPASHKAAFQGGFFTKNSFTSTKNSYLSKSGYLFTNQTNYLSKTASTDQGSDLQRLRDVSPDVRTYRIFIEHCASKSGDFFGAAQYLDEMQAGGIAPDGSIFKHLFRAFYVHGERDYTWWTQEKLDDVWRALLKLVDDDSSGIYVSAYTWIWALKAYVRCYNRKVAMEKWAEIQSRWSKAEDYQRVIEMMIAKASERQRDLEPETYSPAGFYKVDGIRTDDNHE